jgi:hypothetical protein
MTQCSPTAPTRLVGLEWGPWVVGVALLCATAQAVHVDPNRATGSGPDFFQVALIADPHTVYDNLRAAKDTINKLVQNSWGNIQMVIVLGDLTDNADTVSQLPVVRRILDSLAVPYVPLIGNHDIVPYSGSEYAPPRDQNGLFTTRYFNRTFDSVYTALAASTDPPIRDLRRYA